VWSVVVLLYAAAAVLADVSRPADGLRAVRTVVTVAATLVMSSLTPAPWSIIVGVSASFFYAVHYFERFDSDEWGSRDKAKCQLWLMLFACGGSALHLLLFFWLAGDSHIYSVATWTVSPLIPHTNATLPHLSTIPHHHITLHRTPCLHHRTASHLPTPPQKLSCFDLVATAIATYGTGVFVDDRRLVKHGYGMAMSAAYLSWITSTVIQFSFLYARGEWAAIQAILAPRGSLGVVTIHAPLIALISNYLGASRAVYLLIRVKGTDVATLSSKYN